MKNLRIILFLALGAVFTFSSCDAILDQDETDFGKGPILAQFASTSGDLNIIKDAANTPIDLEIPITFYGGKNVPLDRDIQVKVAASPDSDVQEGTGFELLSDTFTIPAGETTANVGIRVFTEPLVPFEFEDLILEITESSESISETNTYTLTLKALDENTLAGTYDVEVGEYYNSGNFIANYGGTVTIEAIAPGLYKHIGIGFWPDNNDFYFSVDEDTGYITVSDKDLNNGDVLLNGSPIMTCDNQYQFEMVTCDETTVKSTLMPDGHHVVEIVTGYFRGVGATREFYEKLVRQ
ncbi:hypothetical protein [Aegicerativicinus sediminis]|uniref:hypothetical protein n=1 Tax=Aegicerativicinus sediminis TaxID=2893202 RepID=UPI001E2FAC2F|nr:hypothetical protein [Aegicerativicinus sediminis]